MQINYLLVYMHGNIHCGFQPHQQQQDKAVKRDEKDESSKVNKDKVNLKKGNC